jgi:2-keto-4-pentenoate hydratase/2-oxohepta-3-ene-1,7-dioic acid hydratase in catechol pathway
MTLRHFSRLLNGPGLQYAERVGNRWHPLNLPPWVKYPAPPTQDPPLQAPDILATEEALLIPVSPSKIIGVGKNYRAHAAEMGGPLPTEPLLFLKAPSALVAPGAPVVLPLASTRVDYEGELVVVIGKEARRVKEAEALEYVFGYTVACDLTARDFQASDGQWARAKSFDTFCPLAPVITSGIDCSNCALTTHVNGVLRQSANTRDMVFSVAQIVSHISQCMTLLPGDIILTGTPDGVGPLSPGDEVTVAIQGLASLHFKVEAESPDDL